MFDAPSAKAHPFLVYQGKLYVGAVDAMHANLLIQKFDSEDLAYSQDGRIWTGNKIITFWEWPKDLKSFLNKLVSAASKQQGIRIDLKTWKIEVTDPDTKKIKYVPIKLVLDKNSKLIKQGKSVMLKHLQSPMDKKGGNVPDNMGSSKPIPGRKKGESPAATRYRLSLSEANQVRDKVYRMAAESAFNDIIKQSKKNSSWSNGGSFVTMETKNGQLAFAIVMADVDTRFKDLVFMIHGVGDTGGVYMRNVFPTGGGGSDIIDLYIIPTKLMDFLKSGQMEKSKGVTAALLDRRGTFVHEMQHYLSINKRRGLDTNKNINGDNKAGSVGYYNTPEELNAYYQQGADAFEQMIKTAVSDPDYREVIKKRYVSNNFNDFIKTIFNKKTNNRIWNEEFLNKLTDDNRRKFIKRLAPLHRKLSTQLYSMINELDEYSRFQKISIN